MLVTTAQVLALLVFVPASDQVPKGRGTSTASTYSEHLPYGQVLHKKLLTARRTRHTRHSRHRRDARPAPDGGARKFPESSSSGSQRQGRRQFFVGGPQILTKSAYSECGIQKVPFHPPRWNRQPRIRNGTCAPYGAFPWTVQIQVKRGGRYEHHCGGSLLNDRYVLTARHCFEEFPKDESYRVVVGQDSGYTRDEREMNFQVEDKKLHERFETEGRSSHDLALLKLRKKGDGLGVRFSPEVSPVCLPSSEHVPDYTHCIIAGWGKLGPYGDVKTDCLRAATVPIVNQNKCVDMYKGTSRDVLNSMVCAGYTSGGVDSCQGDSGGPLVCDIDGSYKLVGVISWGGKGAGCGQAEYPGVYTRVGYYLDWINKNMLAMDSVPG